MSDIVKINFDDGYKNIEINNDPNKIIRINPTDLNVINRLSKLDDEIKEISQKYGDIDLNTVGELANLDHNDPNFEKLKDAAANISKLDMAVKELINKIFGFDISSVVFGDENCLTPAGGKAIFQNFIDKISEFMISEINAQISDKTDKYIQPVIEQSAPPIAGMNPQPSVDISNLTQEQKDAMLSEMLRQSK